jgi:hypothetical protein
MEAIIRTYIVIAALAAVAMSARIHMASTQDRKNAGSNCTVDCSGYNAGYKWAEQRSINDEDYCPDRNKSFYEGCAAYVWTTYEADNGIGVPPPLSPDDDDDDDDN